MKIFVLALLLSVLTGIASSVTAPAPPGSCVDSKRLRALGKRIRTRGVCRARVCFAIDGSNSVGKKNFDLAKRFVNDVASVLSVASKGPLSATQFATRNYPISSLTTDTNSFCHAVNITPYRGGLTNMKAGTYWCITGFPKSPPHDGNVVVVISDGKWNKGGSPVSIAKAFRSVAGKIFGIPVGVPNYEYLEDVVGDEDNIIPVTNYDELADEILNLATKICSL